MGHYYSEMVSDAEQEREAAEKQERNQKRIEKLKKLIEKEGLEAVLLLIIDENIKHRIW